MMVGQDHQPFARSEYAVSNDNVLDFNPRAHACAMEVQEHFILLFMASVR